MKQNLTFAFCYILYFGMAVFMHPVKSIDRYSNDSTVKCETIKEVSLAKEDVGILHSELLFKF